jgi:GR25 family glycosyltransferase involved in LPS biosynthesis
MRGWPATQGVLRPFASDFDTPEGRRVCRRCNPAAPCSTGRRVIPTILINLERDTDRRTTMAARLDAQGVQYTIFKAIHGSQLSPEELDRASPRHKLSYSVPLIPNEIATGLSHRGAIAEGARLDCDFFCVLEDDSVLAPEFASCLDPGKLSALPAFDVLRLCTYPDRWEKPSKIVGYFDDRTVVRMLRPGWGCQGQIYSRNGARKILASLKYISAPIDFALYHDCHVSGLRVLEMRPGTVGRDYTKESSVGDRPPLTHRETMIQRTGRNTYRMRRKVLAAVSFFRAWGVMAFFSFFSIWR